MKKMKSIFAAILITCLLYPHTVMATGSAYAELRFTDPSTAVGEEVEVVATFTGSEAVRSVEASLTYDTDSLRFIEGTQASESEGTIQLSGIGDGTSAQMTFSMKFQALQEGTTRIEIASASGQTLYNAAFNVVNGSSTITIGPGDPSKITGAEGVQDGPQVTVNGASYTIYNGFSDAVVPIGFSKSELSFEGVPCTVVTQNASGTIAICLRSADQEEDFFLYDPDTGTFSPFQQIEIASERYLVFQQNDGTVTIPDGYEETTLTIDGKEFPAWQNATDTEYYLVYGLNSDGVKGLYLYDTLDGTYQRYLASAAAPEESAAKTDGVLGGFLNFIGKHLMTCVMAVAILFFFLLIILIVVSVKLKHRNWELDDLYDEYGIDMEEEDDKPAKAKKKSPSKKKNEDDFYDFEDEDEDDEYDYDELEEDDRNYLEDDDDDDYDGYGDDYGFTADSVNHSDGLDDLDDLDDLEDLDSLLQARVREPEKRSPAGRRRRSEDDGEFQVDFIDLD